MRREITIILVVFLGLPGLVIGQEKTSDCYSHEVKAGETLTEIAVNELGSYALYEEVARDNLLEKPYLIKPGQKLLICVPKTNDTAGGGTEMGMAPVEASIADPAYESYGNEMLWVVLALTFITVFFVGVEKRIRLRDKIILTFLSLIGSVLARPAIVSTSSDLGLFGPGYNYVEDMDGAYTITLVPNEYYERIAEKKGEYYDFYKEEAQLQKTLKEKEVIGGRYLRVMYAEETKREVMPKWAWRARVLALRRSLIPFPERKEICRGFEYYYRIRQQKYRPESYPEEILKACYDQGIPPNLLDSIIAMESGGKADLISYKGAIGVMQIMPSTAKWHGIESAELFDYEENIDFGSAYFAILYEMFGNNIEKTLSAYNRGPGSVSREGVIKSNKDEFVDPILWESDRLLKKATTGVKGGELIVIVDPPHPDESLISINPEKWSPVI